MDLLPLWKSIKKILKEASQEVFSVTSNRIVGKTTDDLTKRAIFFVKVKQVPTQLHLTTQEIMHNQQYLWGFSPADRKKITAQYLLEIRQPLAYVEEYPLIKNENDEYVLKILLVDEKKIICGSATYFVRHDQKTLSLLSHKDVIKITMMYFMERFGDIDDTEAFPHTQHNVHYLNFK